MLCGLRNADRPKDVRLAGGGVRLVYCLTSCLTIHLVRIIEQIPFPKMDHDIRLVHSDSSNQRAYVNPKVRVEIEHIWIAQEHKISWTACSIDVKQIVAEVDIWNISEKHVSLRY